MLSKNKIKYIHSLKLSKFRDEYQQFIAEGDKLVCDLLLSNYKISDIFATKDWIENNPVSNTISVTEVTENELERISQLSTPNKVLAILDYKKLTESGNDIFNELILMLDEIKDPGNMGTIIRIADWFGISNLICSNHSVEIYNPKVVQSTMGSIARVNVTYTDLKVFLDNVPTNIPIYGTLLDGENIYNQDLSSNGIIIVGNESRGISKEIIPFITKKILIPAYAQNKESKAESLNASVATAIVCAEFKRKFN